jgi:hypothetical protein
MSHMYVRARLGRIRVSLTSIFITWYSRDQGYRFAVVWLPYADLSRRGPLFSPLGGIIHLMK